MTPADLKTARQALGMTQVALSRALGMSDPMVGYMETGKGPSGHPVGIEKRTWMAVQYLLLTK